MNESFDNALEFAVGLTQPQPQYFVEQNFTDESILALLDEAAITDLFNKRPFMNASIVMKLRMKAFRSWVQEKGDANIDFDLDDFTEAECNAIMKKMSRKTSSSSQKDRNKKSEVKAPDKFNGKQRNWKSWKAEFEAFLAAIRGENDAPLSYVIGDDDDITQDEMAS
mmetsp:Transcript_18824/g.26697  ORF Transcript_18824/g.26697 Transcript_18824/m.26697 type:complete len:167 (+) Transcript_18824:143-643(+)|eukprot:CAMPEP_0172435458 /NCGR_PEP_ID=MMETSP1064-20121228/71186_1 /TAXON_ID=202472 /ORGANISM="Aulacoseira subarctica , Strain CCAP 1002/5" /LENGTH=166 /DNA_ID=CAMNT_0013183771 /DNA_START=537 /DNA_END=1037 /DNA_ORIENTATION=-